MPAFVASWIRHRLPWDLCHQWIFTMDPDAPTAGDQCPSAPSVYCCNPEWTLLHTNVSNVQAFLRDPTIAVSVTRFRAHKRARMVSQTPIGGAIGGARPSRMRRW